jgi:hypothetical protein
LVQLLAFCIAAVVGVHTSCRLWKKSMSTKILLTLFILMALSHAIGLFVPETGFDALWYHLPMTKLLFYSQRVSFFEPLYQTGLPRLGSFLFLPAFAIEETMVKIVTFSVTLLLIASTALLARRFFKRDMSLLITLVVFSFHVIAWQASSAYVDQIRTLFELLALLWSLEISRESKIRWPFMLIGALLGLSFSTKLVGFLFLPAWAIYFNSRFTKQQSVMIIGVATGILALWVLQTVMQTGELNAFSFLFQVQGDVVHATGWIQKILWILKQISGLPLISFILSFHRESYTTTLFLFSLPFVIVGWKEGWKKYQSLYLFSIVGFLCWLLITPHSVRYGLVWVIVWLLLSLERYIAVAHEYRFVLVAFYVVCLSSIILNMSVRVGANLKMMPYVLERETQEEYVERYAQGILKGPIEGWYGGKDRGDKVIRR